MVDLNIRIFSRKVEKSKMRVFWILFIFGRQSTSFFLCCLHKSKKIKNLCWKMGVPPLLPVTFSDMAETKTKEKSHYFYRIRGVGLIYVLSIVVCIPSTFCPSLGHHQGRIYYKSDVTFVLAYYYYVRASLPLKIMAFAFKWVSIISVSS